jgi:hypothetical protein
MVTLLVSVAVAGVGGCAPEQSVGPAGFPEPFTGLEGNGFGPGDREFEIGDQASAHRLTLKLEQHDRQRQDGHSANAREQSHRALAFEGDLRLGGDATLALKGNLVDSLQSLGRGPHNRLGGALDWRQTKVAETEMQVGLLDDRVRLSSTQALSQFDESDDPEGALESGVAFAQALEADLIRSGEWRISSFVRRSQVDHAFEDDGLPDKGKDLRGRNRSTVSIGSTFGWGPIDLTLARETNERVRDGNGYQEDNVRSMVTVGLEDLSQRFGLESWPALAPDAAWVSVSPGEVDPGGALSSAQDRTLDQGFGLSWAWSGAYADLSFWRYVYDGRQPDAEEADWIGRGAMLALGAYGARWNADVSFGLDQGRNEDPYSRSRDTNFYGSVAVGYRPDKLPDLALAVTLERYKTDYLAYDGGSLTDYAELSAEANFSKFLISESDTEAPSLSLLYWFRGLTMADSFAGHEAEGEHVVGLIYRKKL